MLNIGKTKALVNSPLRNEPCPCRSGEKYIRCCGSLAAYDSVKYNKKIAYANDIGRQREQFCVNYATYKQDLILRSHQFIREKVSAAGESISCKQGCSECCYLYVFANLQEAECITHYLYIHDKVLQHFLTAYQQWRKGLGLFANKLNQLEQMIAGNITGDLSPREQEHFIAAVNGYNACRVPCPFLMENACSIYEVRPFTCAGIFAVTPAEMCSWETPGKYPAKFFRFGFDIQHDMQYFVTPRHRIVSGCMPELVHRILVEGYSFLSNIEGLERLRRPAAPYLS